MSASAAAPLPRLLADIGGTNARFAWQAEPGAAMVAVRTLPCADFATVADAIRAYLQGAGLGDAADCSIAIANPVVGDRVSMTNHHWTFSIRALQAELGFRRLLVINDFTALALALPVLRVDEKRQVGGQQARPDAAIGLIGPGTGLGVSGLIPNGLGGWVPLQGEGGHTTLAATTEREHAVLQQLSARHGHVSAERAVCGQGLVDLHRAVLSINAPSKVAAPLEAAQITASAMDGSDPACVEALSLFCAFLGIAAGNLALTIGAHGGIYIGGGIVPRLGDWFDRSPFRARFEAKGRFSAFLKPVPVYVIQAERSPALLGAAAALDSPMFAHGTA